MDTYQHVQIKRSAVLPVAEPDKSGSGPYQHGDANAGSSHEGLRMTYEPPKVVMTSRMGRYVVVPN